MLFIHYILFVFVYVISGFVLSSSNFVEIAKLLLLMPFISHDLEMKLFG